AKARSILDVGSGLCVFLNLMKQFGWSGTALDPDPRAVAHAREVVGVSAVCGDFRDTEVPPHDVITFNKVLEHIRDPVPVLARASKFLSPGGFVYIELPDGEAAAQDGFHREEFFFEHFHVYSPASVALLATRAGFAPIAIERTREPSSKYTLRAFLVPR